MKPIKSPDVDKLLKKLIEQGEYLALEWKLHVQVFGTSQERVDLLNSAAPLFLQGRGA